MIFEYLKKQKEINKKKQIIKIMIVSLNIPEKQKELYLESISILNKSWLERLFDTLSNFTKEIENNKLNNISNSNFSNIAWMKKKEANEKEKELNSFSFLINNL